MKSRSREETLAVVCRAAADERASYIMRTNGEFTIECGLVYTSGTFRLYAQ